MNVLESPQLQTAVQAITNDLNDKQKSCAIIATEDIKLATAVKVMIAFAKENTLYCAPTTIMIEKIQLTLENMGYNLMTDFKNLQFYTYDQLHTMIKNVKKPDYSLLICDEFSTLNKKKRYQSIKQLFVDNHNQKYFGLSQTPLLQWEYDRIYKDSAKSTKRIGSITKSLYDNTISFFYSIEDALIGGLLSAPIYNEYFTLEDQNPKKVAFRLLQQSRVKNVTEEMIESLTNYLIQESSFVDILKKHIQPRDTKIIYFCKDFQDLVEKEQLLKELFPQLSIYKVASQLDKSENQINIEQFQTIESNEGNSKILLTAKQGLEEIQLDGKVQLIFGTKTNSYKDFTQKFVKGFSLGNSPVVEILDLGGNLTRLKAFDFLELKYDLERKTKRKLGILRDTLKIEYNGNMLSLNDMIKEMARNTFISKKEKTSIYYDRIISNCGNLRNPEEKFRDDTYLRDWEKEMAKIAVTELHLLQENPEYQISEENMYIIETLAYLTDFFQIPKTEIEKSKREEYYKRAILCKDFLLKNKFLRFSDGTYMSIWYQTQKRKVEAILNRIEAKKDYQVTEEESELLLWMHKLHTDMKILWVEKILTPQRKEKSSELYKQWKSISDAVADNPNLLKTKKDWQSLEKFWHIEEFYNGIETRTWAIADKNFPYANIKKDDTGKYKVLKLEDNKQS